MLMVDMHNSSARISLREMRGGGKRYLANPIAFASFVEGWVLSPGVLLDPVWRQSGGASGGSQYFHAVMQELLPRTYDVVHLETLGGRFALRLTDTADYTVIALNRRVITLTGLPLDDATGEPVIDAEVRPDVFMAFCNDRLAQLAETTLARIGAARAASNVAVLNAGTASETL